MKLLFTICLAALSVPSISAAEQSSQSGADTPVVLLGRTQLPAGTPILLKIAKTGTAHGGAWKAGDEFALTVSENVLIGNYVVIPQGTRAVGRVKWVTRRGAIGKSGKIEVEIDHLNLGGKEIRLTGAYRAEIRDGLTPVGRVQEAGPLAGFVTGDPEESAQLTGYLAESLGVVIPYKPVTGTNGGSMITMVRARQISVTEAFADEISPVREPASRMIAARRITVAEAFGPE